MKLSLAHKQQNDFSNPSILSKEVLLCEQHINQEKGFQRITQENFEWFSARLATKNDSDSYLTSPTYYAFTGRDGLWVYDKDDAFIPFCWHPNVPGQLLIFLIGYEGCHALPEFLDKLPSPPIGIRVARLKNAQAKEIAQIKAASFSQPILCIPVVEHVLDWKYPVRILSTEKVAAMEGADFRYIRNHVRQVISKNVQVEPITPERIQNLRHFIHEWAHRTAPRKYEITDYISPYEKILSLIEMETLKADGFLTLINDEIQSLTLWDVSNTGSNQTANRFINICNTKYRGLAEFNTVHMARILASQGIQYINIGGAEKAGLDNFKKKFMPVKSIELCSIDVVEYDADLRYESFVVPELPRMVANV